MDSTKELEVSRKNLRQFQDPRNVFAGEFNEFLRACSEEQEITNWELSSKSIQEKKPRRSYIFEVGLHDFQFSISLYSSLGKLFYPLGETNQKVNSNSALHKFLKFHSASHLQAIDEMRLVVTNKLNLVKSLEEMLRQHLSKDLGLSESETKID